jgi:four helix bundle protein
VKRLKVEYQFSFEKLIAWQKARVLTMLIYSVTGQLPVDEKFGLTSQMRKAVISISSNLAEGSTRSTKNDKLRFVTLSYGSLMELYSQIIIANDLGYINTDVFDELKSKVIELSNIINGLKNAFSKKTQK